MKKEALKEAASPLFYFKKLVSFGLWAGMVDSVVHELQKMLERSS